MEHNFYHLAALQPWHNVIWQRLTGRFPDLGHGLLFYGKQGCAKRQFASHFAKWLLCIKKQAHGACQECHSCKWFAAGTHPQLKLIHAEFDEKKQNYSAIKIDQIREIADFVQQTVDGWRVVIIEPAEYLNIAAANALLKTLEEPGERVVLILISDSMLKLPATIRSRVQHFALDRISLDEAQQYLAQTATEKSSVEMSVALTLAQNMPLKAAQILASDWFSQRAAFIQAWIVLVSEKAFPIKFSSYWYKQIDFRELLALVRYSIQDCIAFKLQQPLQQTDVAIESLQGHYSLQQLFAIYQQINKMNSMLAQNVQTQLIFDELTMQLMNVSSMQ